MPADQDMLKRHISRTIKILRLGTATGRRLTVRADLKRFLRIEVIAAHPDGYSVRCSSIIRKTRTLIRRVTIRLFLAPSPSRNEVSTLSRDGLEGVRPAFRKFSKRKAWSTKASHGPRLPSLLL
jgi:hypothetical protein